MNVISVSQTQMTYFHCVWCLLYPLFFVSKIVFSPTESTVVPCRTRLSGGAHAVLPWLTLQNCKENRNVTLTQKATISIDLVIVCVFLYSERDTKPWQTTVGLIVFLAVAVHHRILKNKTKKGWWKTPNCWIWRWRETSLDFMWIWEWSITI